jgi:hypothetical protein
MVLNFTYNRFAPLDCDPEKQRDVCIRRDAVHEFGHALGFAHEQNRRDTPDNCKHLASGGSGDTTTLTPWDPKSVMNYCNKDNTGKLSEFDIKALRYIYGGPKN